MKRPLSLALVAVIVLAGAAFAVFGGVFSDHPSVALDTFNDVYGTKGTRLDTCSACHTRGRLLNSYGQDGKAKFSAVMVRGPGTEEQQVVAFVEALKAIEQMDSDSDGFSNVDEIKARTFPGNANDHP